LTFPDTGRILSPGARQFRPRSKHPLGACSPGEEKKQCILHLRLGSQVIVAAHVSREVFVADHLLGSAVMVIVDLAVVVAMTVVAAPISTDQVVAISVFDAHFAFSRIDSN
jgi:hypothetical protein